MKRKYKILFKNGKETEVISDGIPSIDFDYTARKMYWTFGGLFNRFPEEEVLGIVCLGDVV